MRPVVVLLALLAAATPLLAQGPALGAPAVVAFPLAVDLEPGPETVAIAAHGRLVVATSSDGSLYDVVITELGPDGTVLSTQTVAFPLGVDVHPVNRGFALPDDGRFVACHGDQSFADLVLIRPNAAGTWTAQLVDLPGLAVPPLGGPPVTPPDGRYVVTRSGGGAVDLVLTPVGLNAQGLVTALAPVAVAFPGAADLPLQTGVRPVVTPDGRAVAAPTTALAADLAVVTVPAGFPAQAPVVTAVDYPGGNTIPDPAAPIAVDPGSRWFATWGQPVAGDVVVTALDPLGHPVAAQGVPLPAQNNPRDTSRPIAHGRDGRVLVVTGTQAAGDLALIPVDLAGVPGPAVNVAYPAQNFVPLAAPDARVSASGRVAVSAGSDTLGDVVVTRIVYDPATNTVQGLPTNVLFPGTINRRLPGDDVAIAPDGSAIAVFSGNGANSDLTVIGLDAAGVPLIATSLLLPLGNNVDPQQTAPLFSPGSQLVAVAGDEVLGDLVAIGIVRDAQGRPVPGAVATVVYPTANDNAFGVGPLRFSPSGSFVLAPGNALGDLVITRVTGPRVFVPAPARIGGAVPLRLVAPTAAGEAYVLGVSATRTPEIAVGDGRTFPIGYDALLEFSLTSGDPAFFAFQGVLDADGLALAALYLPPLPELRGVVLHTAFATLDAAAASGIGVISAPTALVLE